MKKDFKWRKVVPRTALLFTALVLFTISAAQAQKFYLRAGGGYSIQSGKTEFNNADPNGITGITQSTDITSNGNTTTIKSLNGTVGEGFKFTLAPGYMFNPYIGAEIGINYFHGNEVLIGRLSTPSRHAEENTYLRGVDLTPAIVITPGFAKLNPYARVGSIFPAAGHLTINTDITQYATGSSPQIDVNAETEVKAKFTVGFIGALGVLYPVSDKVSIFGEVEFKNFSIQSKNAEIKKYSTTATSENQSSLVPGQQLGDLPVNQKKFTFNETYTPSNDTNQPKQVPQQYVNASGLGLNLGIRLSF